MRSKSENNKSDTECRMDFPEGECGGGKTRWQRNHGGQRKVTFFKRKSSTVEGEEQ